MLGAGTRFMGTDGDRARFATTMDRANFINSQWYSEPEYGLGFRLADPELTKTYIEDGRWGLHQQAPRIWQRTIADEAANWRPADISKAGEFAQRRAASGRPSILTVTPNGNSARFGPPVSSGTLDPNSYRTGGGASNTLWGNGAEPQYSYAEGNWGVGKQDFQNPSAHFSEVQLPPDERTEYLTTGEANRFANQAGNGRGWGVAGRDQEAPVDSGRDVHFGKEYRRRGGVTTANDMYTWLKGQGVEPPDPTGQRPGDYLQSLTQQVRELTQDAGSDYQVLENMASPTPLWGDQERELGQLPKRDRLKWKDKHNWGLGEGAHDGGASTFFDLRPTSADAPLDPDWVNTNGYTVDADAFISPRILDDPGGFGRGMIRRGVPGLAGTVATSPEAAQQLRDGNYGNAALITGASYGVGEAIGAGVNRLAAEAVKRGHLWAPRALNGLGAIAPPLLINDAIETGTVLATGKTREQIITESGNQNLVIPASVPQTMAPLGSAGHMNANVPVDADQNARWVTREQKTQKQVDQAKERGGQWGIGGINLPEFGITEQLGAANTDLKDVKRGKVMAVLNGQEGYMMQGDPSSFQMGNWNEEQRARYKGGGKAPSIPAPAAPTPAPASTAKPSATQGRPQKVMAVLNGQEGYMLQGDSSSFQMGNWNDEQRNRYYGR